MIKPESFNVGFGLYSNKVVIGGIGPALFA